MMKCHVGDHTQYVPKKKEKEKEREPQKEKETKEEKPQFFKRLSKTLSPLNLFEHKRIPSEILESWS